jgi:hypothetical protein
MNRPVSNRRPVLLSFLIGIILIFSIFPATGIVQAKTNLLKPTPDNQIEIPESGEPVILQPGNNARLVSPLKLQLITKPGDDGLVRIELIGHDNRLIFRKLMDYRSYRGQTLLVEQQVKFEIRDDESARLQIVLEDVKGRLTFLTSINLTLLGVRGSESGGELPVNPRFRINQPDLSSEITGKNLSLRCDIKPINNSPIIAELIAKDGHTMSSRLIQITLPNDQTTFAALKAELPFDVSSPTQVSFRIRQESNSLIKGTVLLWSSKVILSP